MVEYLAAIKDNTFNNAGFLAKGTLTSAPPVPQSTQQQKIKTRGESGKNEAECMGKVEITQVVVLPQDETCKAVFFPTPALGFQLCRVIFSIHSTQVWGHQNTQTF